MPVTLRDIAQRVKVDRATVSYVLNGKGDKVGIAKPTQQRIFKVAKDLHYRPSFAARALATGKTHTIGVLGGQISNPHYSELMGFFVREVEARGYQVAFSLTQWVDWADDLVHLDTLLNRGVDGLFVQSSALRPGTSQYETVMRERIPTILLNATVEGLSSLESDWTGGISQAVEHLHGKGHRRIGLVMAETSSPGSPKRQVFLTECGRHGIETADVRAFVDPAETRKYARGLAEGGDLPGALLVWSDHMAIAFCAGLWDAGLDVPRDIAIVGMDGTDAGGYYRPPLTSIAQDRPRIAAEAAQMFLEQQDPKLNKPQRRLVPTKLIVRDSA